MTGIGATAGTRWRWLAALVSLATATSANAVSLTMGTDQSVYVVGESIVVTLVGGTTGGSSGSVIVDVGYDDDALVTAPATASQSAAITSFGGIVIWEAPSPACGPSVCTVLNQLISVNPFPADPDIIIGTLVLTAAAPGVLVLTTGVSEPVRWFGAPPPPDVTVTIVPEPGTLPLLGLGLLGLCWNARRGPPREKPSRRP